MVTLLHTLKVEMGKLSSKNEKTFFFTKIWFVTQAKLRHNGNDYFRNMEYSAQVVWTSVTLVSSAYYFLLAFKNILFSIFPFLF